ncbi:MAG: hypothetical protein Q7R96_06120 [Nanoarchaeota archaeon]|nr:hypothetical protein [Nanoarchaeota archaeon]
MNRGLVALVLAAGLAGCVSKGSVVKPLSPGADVFDSVIPPKPSAQLPPPQVPHYVQEVRDELGDRLVRYGVPLDKRDAAVADIEKCFPLTQQVYGVLSAFQVDTNRLNPAVEEIVNVRTDKELSDVLARYVPKDQQEKALVEIKDCTHREELWVKVLSKYGVPGMNIDDHVKDLGNFYEKIVPFIERYGFMNPKELNLEHIDTLPGTYKQ